MNYTPFFGGHGYKNDNELVTRVYFQDPANAAVRSVHDKA